MNRRALRVGLLTTVVALGVGLLSCVGGPRPVTAPVPALAASEIAWTVILIGDGGEPRPGEPVLGTLTREAGRTPARTTVVFLGDNVYPVGIPDSSSPGRAEMELRLTRQLDALRASGARGFVLPGNHDWAKGSAEGWDAIRREERVVRRYAGDIAEFVPGDGCPGPVVRDVGPSIRLILLDTQWWLQKAARPVEGSSCRVDTPAEVTAALKGALTTGGTRRLIVAGHHPYASGSEHGGHFTFEQNVFPLRALASWLWLPLPVIGSLVPAARLLGISTQDIASSRYQEMIRAFDSATAGHRPMLWAAGHEHTLQVLEGGLADWLVVSGTGYYGHTSPAGWLDQTRFAAAEAGFMRVDLLTDGRVRLGVITVDQSGTSREAWSGWL
jgi:hypothetical protein